ncbi:MAG: cell division protein FtsX [Methyloceanibacter sp.]|uniref:cell division protein FtsX n=1 Tax=Methyloceanibacter sp. TaxID=1965321 RepID=UPI003D9B8704
MTPATILADIRGYPWAGLLAELLPARLATRLPAQFQATAVPIVPSESIAGRALIVVIAIMSFLACLTAGAVYMINQSAQAWVNDITSEITIELDPVNSADIDKKMTLVALFLAKQQGITRVKPQSAEESAKLLEPWLGHSEALSALPIPRLIAVEIDRSNPPDIQLIKEALSQNFEGVTLDDHRRWQAEIRTLTRSAALGGLAILALVAAATIAVIVSATRSAMASNREIIEVLHFVGASERFISHEFERHFLGLGVRAGLVGAVAAALVFWLMPLVTHMLGSGIVAAAEMRRLVGSGELDLAGYFVCLLVVFVVAGLCMITSRLGVIRVLKTYA